LFFQLIFVFYLFDWLAFLFSPTVDYSLIGMAGFFRKRGRYVTVTNGIHLLILSLISHSLSTCTVYIFGLLPLTHNCTRSTTSQNGQHGTTLEQPRRSGGSGKSSSSTTKITATELRTKSVSSSPQTHCTLEYRQDDQSD
jgi:hypothetical protein